MSYANIDSYLTCALFIAGASVVAVSFFAYWVRDHRWWLAVCGITLLGALLLATPALSQLYVLVETAEGINAAQKAALKAKITGHLGVLSIIFGSIGANLLTNALTKSGKSI
jgi:hypothetical protein